MTNPYQSPTSEIRERLSRVREPTERIWLARIVGAACFFVGCPIGMNLGVVVDEGYDRAVERFWMDPLNAMFVFATIALFCLTVVGIWKYLRGFFAERYVAPPDARFVAGLLLMAAFYIGVTQLERHFRPASDSHIAATIALGIAIVFLVTEIEAFWTWLRQPGRVAAATEPAT